MSPHFTHLHLHTEYSLLDGAIGIDDLVSFGVANGFRALGISDHGNVFGAVKFFQKAKAAKLKPVLGMEAYFTEDCAIKNAEKKYYHLLIVVLSQQGYKNLCKLIAASFQEGFYFKPRIDYNLLKKYHEGLLVTSACLGGHIPQLLMNDQEAEARSRINWFLDLFGPERFYLEVQPEEQEEQRILNQKIFTLSAEYGIGTVATGDCHYVHKEDRTAHEVMLAVQTRAKMSDADRFTFGECRAHMRTAEEMLAIFPNHPEAVWNSGKIADMCDFDFTTGKLHFPQFPLPEKTSAESHFAALCQQGLDDLITQNRIAQSEIARYQARLDEEVNLITRMGFVGYFLVVSDFIQWAKRAAIPVGPGRGSVAGSLVAWALQITDVDPLAYNLLFERFLNPERISMPDIDIDFCIEGRERVIEYVRERYGHDHVCQIITFGTMMAKGVIKDVARALGMPFDDSQAITELISDQLKITLDEAIEQEPRLKQLIESNADVAELFAIARRLEGLTRHASKHAAGVVITPEPVTDMLPVYIPPKSTELVTQYAMTELETLGFLKMDFLGLKNLTLIQQVVDAIRVTQNIELDITRLPLDDPKTFALFCRGDTSGVFQFESSGLKEVLQRLQPQHIEDIIAANALYRPGPLGAGMVDDFIERRHGRAAVTYMFPQLEPILAPTYGVIVYQEQVMQIATAIAGYSLGESDILRRAMGKKKAEEMAKQKAIFVDKATARAFDSTKAAELFDLMAYFAGYGFNKSHSTAYALIAYQTAYLKAHFPAEFMAALISLDSSVPETMAAYIQEAQRMGIAILPPDLNASPIQFRAETPKSIRFGLVGIRNVGDAALSAIVEQRHKNGPFSDMLDLCIRVDTRVLNKRVLESLIASGACDAFPGTRAQKQEMLTAILEGTHAYKQQQSTGQMSLFGATPHIIERPKIPLPSAEPWSHATTLLKEKEILGLYMSGHPLDSYQPYIAALSAGSPQGPEMRIVCGSVTTKKMITTKKGDRMAFITLATLEEPVEVVLFPKTYEAVAPWLETYSLFIVRGAEDAGGSLRKIKARDCIPLDLMKERAHNITEVVLIVPPHLAPELLSQLKSAIVPGSIPLTVHMHRDGGIRLIKTQVRMLPTEQFLTTAASLNVVVQLRW